MRLRTTALLAYVVLLGASYAVWFAHDTQPPDPAPSSVPVRVVDGDEVLARETPLGFRDERGEDARTPVVLLHGSPGGRGDFNALLRALRGARRAIVPDLPGFGSSRAALPDYSIDAHARYVLQLLDALGVERAHLVGFSMGGGVAVTLQALAPERVASLALVAAIGVQELELFGDYRLNHAVHGVQLALLQAARFGLPHFGTFDRNPLSIAYARNFYDTDQRPLRAMLERYDGPLLVVHGKEDFLVPFAAAEEHVRIVPQARLDALDASHFILWTRTADVASSLDAFFDQVDAGVPLTRADATPQRVAASAEPFDPANVPPARGPALLILMLVIIAATLVSEDLTCIAAGLLVAQGRIQFLPATIACFAGIFIGDVLLFLAGRALGRPAAKRAPFKWVLSPASVERASEWFRRRGVAVIFFSRFLPGLRLPTYFVAGVLRTRFALFATYFFIACAVWTPILVGFSSWVGGEAQDSLELFRSHALTAFIVLAALILVVQRLVVPLFSYRGRRMLLGAWRRKVQWEFWPPYVFYVPPALYFFFLALRHRSVAMVTAANPGIPTGGFIGESKRAILDALRDEDGAVARYVGISADLGPADRVRVAREFIASERLSLPIVWKPDVGQRGTGVRILADEDALERHLASAEVDGILQEYVAGPEFGVFYYRLPGEERGRIFSITEKHLPVVTGDGQSTLERLILADERAVCIARTYFEANASRLLDVPTKGEEVQLVPLGTHARGAVFRDGRRLITPELEEAIERVSRRFDGFYFGRYDLRATSSDDLALGRGFKILELNGLTSEATHIYDPAVSLAEAYGVLFEQWRLGFTIARANRENGVRPATTMDLVREMWRYRKLSSRHTTA